MTCWKPERLWLKKTWLIEDGRSFQVFIIAVAIMHEIIGVVLAKGLAMVPDNDEDRTVQEPLFLQIVEDSLDHVIEQIQVVIVSINPPAVLFANPVLPAVVEIGKVGRETEIDAQKGFFGPVHPLNEKIDGLDFVPSNVVAQGVIFLLDLQVQILVTVDLPYPAVFGEGRRKIPGDWRWSYQKAGVTSRQKIVKGRDLGVRPDAERFPVEEVERPLSREKIALLLILAVVKWRFKYQPSVAIRFRNGMAIGCPGLEPKAYRVPTDSMMNKMTFQG